MAELTIPVESTTIVAQGRSHFWVIADPCARTILDIGEVSPRVKRNACSAVRDRINTLAAQTWTTAISLAEAKTKSADELRKILFHLDAIISETKDAYYEMSTFFDGLEKHFGSSAATLLFGFSGVDHNCWIYSAEASHFILTGESLFKLIGKSRQQASELIQEARASLGIGLTTCVDAEAMALIWRANCNNCTATEKLPLKCRILRFHASMHVTEYSQWTSELLFWTKDGSKEQQAATIAANKPFPEKNHPPPQQAAAIVAAKSGGGSHRGSRGRKKKTRNRKKVNQATKEVNQATKRIDEALRDVFSQDEVSSAHAIEFLKEAIRSPRMCVQLGTNLEFAKDLVEAAADQQSQSESESSSGNESTKRVDQALCDLLNRDEDDEKTSCAIDCLTEAIKSPRMCRHLGSDLQFAKDLVEAQAGQQSCESEIVSEGDKPSRAVAIAGSQRVRPPHLLPHPVHHW